MKNLGIIMHAGPIDDLKNRQRFDAILEAREARALAQFLKRVSFSTCERHAENKAEAYEMIDALNALQNVINAAGFNPR